VRVGVVGTGFGARVVAPVFDQTEGCAVVDVVTARDARAVAALASRPDVDLLSVHSPPFLHAEHVRLALAHGKAVLCDKPFATTPAEAAALRAEADAAGVVHLVNFEFRQHPARRLLRALVGDGVIGQVEHVSWVHLSAGSRVPLRPYGWLFDRALGGGWIGAWASHAVDTLRFCFGEVVSAVGVPRTDVPRRPDADGRPRTCTAEDGLAASLVLATGATVSLDSSFAATASPAPRLTVAGSEGVVEIVADARFTVHRAGGRRDELPLPDTSGPERHDVAMRRWAPLVRAAVESGAVPDDAPTFADGEACDVVLAALRGSGGERSREQA
jgi:predicted dehydrogenase